MNTKQIGNIGLGQAVAFFLKKGYPVSIPINDSQSYDLVVDFPEIGLKKVEVKTTTYKSKYGIYVVGLRLTGGNQSFNYAKNFHQSQTDFVFAHIVNGDSYLIPSDKCTTNALNLGEKYKEYKILGDVPIGDL